MTAGASIWKLPLILICVVAVQAVLLLFPGHLAISGHEVDVLHATEAAMRLSLGQLQHIDFLTPLGVLAFEPIAVFLQLGLGIGTANIAANLAVALFFLPFLVWVGRRRLSGGLAATFGALTLLMVCAIVYGGPQATVSMSMHYNRWGWAAVFVIALLMLLPTKDAPRPKVEGAIIGVMLGYLLLLKATFFVVLAPVVGIVLLVDRDWQKLLAAVVSGLVVLLIATLIFGGLEFWRHYLLDLLFVSGSEVRPRPGKEFTETLALPAFFPATMCLLAAIVGLRSAGLSHAGLVLFLFAPGFVYITYQNWGNDTKWLLPLGFACFAWAAQMGDRRVYGWDGRLYFLVLGFVSLALITPSFVNMATSPIRNIAASGDKYVSVMHDPRHAGLIIERKRSYVAEAMIAVAGVEDPNPPEDADEDAPSGLALGDFEIPKCNLKTGYYGLMQRVADDLVEAGYADSALAFVDVANPLPLFAPLKRLDYASPWYYGGTRDADGADYIVVPKCPISQPTFDAYISALNAGETQWLMKEEREFVWIFSR